MKSVLLIKLEHKGFDPQFEERLGLGGVLGKGEPREIQFNGKYTTTSYLFRGKKNGLKALLVTLKEKTKRKNIFLQGVLNGREFCGC